MTRFAIQADRSIYPNGRPVDVLVYVGWGSVASVVSPAVIPQPERTED